MKFYCMVTAKRTKTERSLTEEYLSCPFDGRIFRVSADGRTLPMNGRNGRVREYFRLADALGQSHPSPRPSPREGRGERVEHLSRTRAHRLLPLPSRGEGRGEG